LAVVSGKLKEIESRMFIVLLHRYYSWWHIAISRSTEGVDLIIGVLSDEAEASYKRPSRSFLQRRETPPTRILLVFIKVVDQKLVYKANLESLNRPSLSLVIIGAQGFQKPIAMKSFYSRVIWWQTG
jgi:hypothetical protein